MFRVMQSTDGLVGVYIVIFLIDYINEKVDYISNLLNLYHTYKFYENFKE